MLIGLAVITIFGRHELLISSTIFLGGMILLYFHLIDEVVDLARSQLRRRATGPVTT